MYNGQITFLFSHDLLSLSGYIPHTYPIARNSLVKPFVASVVGYWKQMYIRCTYKTQVVIYMYMYALAAAINTVSFLPCYCMSLISQLQSSNTNAQSP